MRIIVFFIFLIIPFTQTSASLEFFLGDGVGYDRDIITSPIYGGEHIFVEYNYRPEPFPQEYIGVDTVMHEVIETMIRNELEETIIESEIPQYATELYETLLTIEHPQFVEYIQIAIQESTDIILQEKIENNILLTPFEETFLNCDIPLDERQAIVLDLLLRIESGEIESLDMISYLNPSFGDCIIPFPDITRSDEVIENSFQSNRELIDIINGVIREYEIDSEISIAIQRNDSMITLYQTRNEILEELLRDKKISFSIYEKLSSDVSHVYHQLLEIQSILLQSEGENNISKYFETLLEDYTAIYNYLTSQYELGNLSLKDYIKALKKLDMYIENKKQILDLYIYNDISEGEYLRKMGLLKDY
ncbi:hypothetical protein LAT59_03515, partial [Candidatus Gracilibacteria bacterium]|nr:hypothetical protein [Candidatus Gracilibacteria bacterium]